MSHGIPSWLKVLLWLLGSGVALWGIIDAARGYWGMYQEYGPSVHSAAHYWWKASPFRAIASVAIIAAVVAGGGFYLWAKHPVTPIPSTEVPLASLPPAVSMVVPAPREPFVVTGITSVPAIDNSDPMTCSWWVVYEMGHKKFRSPITNLVNIALTSQRPGVLTISSYSIEVRGEGGEWKKMTRLPTISDDVAYFHASSSSKENQFTKAVRIEFTDIFDRLIIGKQIRPFEPFQGWLFLESPKEFVGEKRLDWRMRITDITNVEFVQNFTPAPKGNEGYESMAYGDMITRGFQDISDSTSVLYSEKHWR